MGCEQYCCERNRMDLGWIYKKKNSLKQCEVSLYKEKKVVWNLNCLLCFARMQRLGKFWIRSGAFPIREALYTLSYIPISSTNFCQVNGHMDMGFGLTLFVSAQWSLSPNKKNPKKKNQIKCKFVRKICRILENSHYTFF